MQLFNLVFAFATLLTNFGSALSRQCTGKPIFPDASGFTFRSSNQELMLSRPFLEDLAYAPDVFHRRVVLTVRYHPVLGAKVRVQLSASNALFEPVSHCSVLYCLGKTEP